MSFVMVAWAMASIVAFTCSSSLGSFAAAENPTAENRTLHVSAAINCFIVPHPFEDRHPVVAAHVVGQNTAFVVPEHVHLRPRDAFREPSVRETLVHGGRSGTARQRDGEASPARQSQLARPERSGPPPPASGCRGPERCG